MGWWGGQVADIEAEGNRVGPEMLEYIHRSKTAALIRASITAGALSAGAPEVDVKRLREFGENDRLGVSSNRRHSGRRRIFRRAGKDRGQGISHNKRLRIHRCSAWRNRMKLQMN